MIRRDKLLDRILRGTADANILSLNCVNCYVVWDLTSGSVAATTSSRKMASRKS